MTPKGIVKMSVKSWPRRVRRPLPLAPEEYPWTHTHSPLPPRSATDTGLPAEFFLQTVLAVMSLVHGVVFFVLNRSEDEDGIPEDDHA